MPEPSTPPGLADPDLVRQLMTSRRPAPLVVACTLLAASGAAFVGVAIAVLATRVATFSVGVSAMLALYGLLVVAVAVAGWRRRGFAWGAMVAASLLHVLVLLSLARGGRPLLFGLLALVPMATIACALMPETRRCLGR